MHIKKCLYLFILLSSCGNDTQRMESVKFPLMRLTNKLFDALQCHRLWSPALTVHASVDATENEIRLLDAGLGALNFYC